MHRETRTSLRGTDFSAKGVFRFSVAYFLGALILNILVSPFVDQFRGGFLVETALMTLVFLSALLTIGGRLRTLVGTVLVAPALVGEWLSYWRPELPLSVMISGGGVLFLGFGDIIPLSGVARMLAMVEAVFGMFYVTLLIARLVSLYSAKSPIEAVNSEEIADNKRIGLEISQTNK
jgi:hypothetical protein